MAAGRLCGAHCCQGTSSLELDVCKKLGLHVDIACLI